MGPSRVKGFSILLFVFCLILLAAPTFSEIHRARSVQTFKHRFRKLDTSEKSVVGEWTKWFEEKVWGHPRRVWLYSSISAGLVGMTGLFPLLVIPVNCGAGLKSKAANGRLQMLLSFAVGGLLGDVFLHLLPEAWIHVNTSGNSLWGYRSLGGWVLAGLLSFYVIEKLFGDKDDDDDDEKEDEEEEEEKKKEGVKEVEEVKDLNGNKMETLSTSSDDSFDGDSMHRFARSIRRERSGQRNWIEDVDKSERKMTRKRNLKKSLKSELISHHDDVVDNNASLSVLPSVSRLPPPSAPCSSTPPATGKGPVSPDKPEHIKVSGWLNLLANVVDNFTHGLAVAGSYSISSKMGLLTTLAILLHEIPHEIGDFAILLQAGFDRWKAAKVQVLTATGGIIGAMLALSAESAKILGDSTAWILPFTAGGFINIALITIVPDILKETNARNSLKQLLLVCTGIFVMGLVTALVD